MHSTRIMTWFLSGIALTLFVLFFGLSTFSPEKTSVTVSQTFSFLRTDGFVLQQTGVNACSGYTPGISCTATTAATRVCAARGSGGACACVCLNQGSSAKPDYKWLCTTCNSGKCDSFNMKCG